MFLTLQGFILETNMIALGSLKRSNGLYLYNYYVLNTVFSYTQVVFVFFVRGDFYIYLGLLFAFCLFLLRKGFGIFLVLFFRVFLCVFDNISLPFLYLEKIMEKFLYLHNYKYFTSPLYFSIWFMQII